MYCTVFQFESYSTLGGVEAKLSFSYCKLLGENCFIYVRKKSLVKDLTRSRIYDVYFPV